MRQRNQDAMAIVSSEGFADVFVTFTCIPKWTEIADELLPGQTAQDRPDIVSRVFNFKVKVKALFKWTDQKWVVWTDHCAHMDV